MTDLYKISLSIIAYLKEERENDLGGKDSLWTDYVKLFDFDPNDYFEYSSNILKEVIDKNVQSLSISEVESVIETIPIAYDPNRFMPPGESGVDMIPVSNQEKRVYVCDAIKMCIDEFAEAEGTGGDIEYIKVRWQSNKKNSTPYFQRPEVQESLRAGAKESRKKLEEWKEKHGLSTRQSNSLIDSQESDQEPLWAIYQDRRPGPKRIPCCIDKYPKETEEQKNFRMSVEHRYLAFHYEMESKNIPMEERKKKFRKLQDKIIRELQKSLKKEGLDKRK